MEEMEQFEESTTTDLSLKSEEVKLLEMESLEEMESVQQSVPIEIQWKIIKEFPNYRISNTGIVKNFNTKRKIEQKIFDDYNRVRLRNSDDTKSGRYFVHRLVAEYFIPNPNNFRIVEHINQDKLNNNISNLKWTNKSIKFNDKEIEEFDLDDKLVEWKIIKDNPEYEISNTGIVIEIKTGMEIKTKIDGEIRRFFFNHNGSIKNYSIHRLVAEYFVENTNPEKFKVVEHIDKNVLNNIFSNLKWTTRYEKNRSLTPKHEETKQYDSDGKLIEWKIIKDFPNYRISNTGVIKNFTTGYIKNQRSTSGYYMVYLNDFFKKPKKILVHRLIAECFIENPEPENFKIVDHIDGDKLNNDISNLRWCDQSINVRNWHSKRIYYDKIEQYTLDGTLIKVWNTTAEAGRELKINRNYIRNCCISNDNDNDGNSSYGGFIWRHENRNREQKIKYNIDMNEYTNMGVIKGHDFSNYVISNDGSKIINLKRKEEIKFGSSFEGYKTINLYIGDGKKISLMVHKIINQVLMGGKYDDNIDHKNSKKYDNSISNLEAVTHRVNTIRANGKSVRQINLKTGETIQIFRSASEAYESLNKKPDSSIGRVCNEKQKSTLGYGWEWVVNN